LSLKVNVTATPQTAERVSILGLPVDKLTMDEAIEKIEAFVASKKPHIIVTADSSAIVRAQSDDEFRRIVESADLVTPDSTGVVWAARRKGTPVKERVSGVDLADRICARSADKGWRIFLLGAAPGVAEIAAEKMRLRHPGCNIVGARHGYFPEDSDEIVAKEVAEKKPDVLFVAMGIPRQEKFIARTQAIVGASVAMGVGGTLDVLSGRAKRAPKFVQNMSMEWLWRLILNPKKWSKARSLPRFAWMVLREKR
jgi:N-acetylglucosaminyldiphosphoundecaprenol N-acetyl-beta-D-mannosaminyltransferase